MIPKHHKLYVIFTSIILLCLLVGISLFLVADYNGQNGEGEVFVVKIIDGDTLELSDGTKVRLLCVNTPEQGEEGYERAKKFLEALTLYKKLRLEKGETLDEVDKYSRNLRFVYVTLNDKEIFINKEIVRLGFGDFYDYMDEEGECSEKILV